MALYHSAGFGTPTKAQLSTPSRAGCSSHRQRTAVKSSQDSGSDSEWIAPLLKPEKQRRFRSSPSSGTSSVSSSLTLPFSSVGRAVAFAAFCSSVVAVVISLFAVWFFYSSSVLELYSDHQLITTTSVVRTRFRSPQQPQSTSIQLEHDRSRETIVHHQKRSKPQLPSVPILLSHIAKESVQFSDHDERHQLESNPRSPKFWLPTSKLNFTTSSPVHRSRIRGEVEGAYGSNEKKEDDGGMHPHVAVSSPSVRNV
jgi:hypothetical protein